MEVRGHDFDIKLHEAGSSGVPVSVDAEVHNPNWFPAEVEEVEYTLYIDGDTQVASGEVTGGMYVEPGETVEVGSRMEMRYVGTFQGIRKRLEAYFTGESVNWRVTGNVKLGFGPVVMPIPFERKNVSSPLRGSRKI